MSYGLNNIIKKILPKGLFYRSLIIVITPIILLQIIITTVFFDSLWIKVNKGMTKSLVGEIKTLLDVYQGDQSNKKDARRKRRAEILNCCRCHRIGSRTIAVSGAVYRLHNGRIFPRQWHARPHRL